MRTITVGGKRGRRYWIRGTGVTASDLRRRYAAFVEKFGPGTGFEEWLRTRGGVYARTDPRAER